MKSAIKGHIVLTFHVWKEENEDEYTGRCIEFNVSSSGHTVDEALRMTCEAALLHLNTLAAVGECERVFAENNIIIREGAAGPDTEGENVRVPVNSIVSRKSIRLPTLALA